MTVLGDQTGLEGKGERFKGQSKSKNAQVVTRSETLYSRSVGVGFGTSWVSLLTKHEGQLSCSSILNWIGQTTVIVVEIAVIALSRVQDGGLQLIDYVTDSGRSIEEIVILDEPFWSLIVVLKNQ